MRKTGLRLIRRRLLGGDAPKAAVDGPQAAAGEDEGSRPAKKTARPAPVEIIRQFELVDRVRAYDPHVDEDRLNRAYVFSMKAHGGQTRKSGDPYFTHPLAVAAILTDLKADPASVVTALLHDVVEDTDTTIEDIRKLFGDEIAHLVDGVTKLSQIELKSEASKQAENFRKLSGDGRRCARFAGQAGGPLAQHAYAAISRHRGKAPAQRWRRWRFTPRSPGVSAFRNSARSLKICRSRS
ncbi:MAG: HD domain-containing protein [Parvularculaceae bacterium]